MPRTSEVMDKGEGRSFKRDPTQKSVGPTASSTKKPSRRSFRDIDADPPLRRQLFFEQAHRLATMPRLKVGETFFGALWTTVATLPGASAAYVDLTKSPPNQSLILNLASIGTFIISLAFTATALFASHHNETSKEYLDTLYGIPQKPPGRFRRWWRKCME
jgi:hypothetical protein